jgi:hypothetical protein
MKAWKVILGGIGLFLLVIAIGWGGQAYDLFYYSFWAPKYESVKRDVFKQTYSYTQGNTQEARNYMMRIIVEKDPNAKICLKDAFLHQFANDKKMFPQDIQDFISNLERE